MHKQWTLKGMKNCTGLEPNQDFWGPSGFKGHVRWGMTPETLQRDQWERVSVTSVSCNGTPLYHYHMYSCKNSGFENPAKVGREEEGLSSNRPELVVLRECLEAHDDHIGILYSTDSETSLQAINK